MSHPHNASSKEMVPLRANTTVPADASASAMTSQIVTVIGTMYTQIGTQATQISGLTTSLATANTTRTNLTSSLASVQVQLKAETLAHITDIATIYNSLPAVYLKN